MNGLLIPALACFALFVALLVMQELGRRLGRRLLANDPQGARVGLGPMESGVMAVFGLLLAFSFNGAAERYEHRRKLVGEETNAVGTAWLRLDLLPPEQRGPLQESFRGYLGARLD